MLSNKKQSLMDEQIESIRMQIVMQRRRLILQASTISLEVRQSINLFKKIKNSPYLLIPISIFGLILVSGKTIGKKKES